MEPKLFTDRVVSTPLFMKDPLTPGIKGRRQYQGQGGEGLGASARGWADDKAGHKQGKVREGYSLSKQPE